MVSGYSAWITWMHNAFARIVIVCTRLIICSVGFGTEYVSVMGVPLFLLLR